MNAETFLKNFSHIANAERGIRRVRDLVLFAAITGKLSLPRKGDSDAALIGADSLRAKERYDQENNVRRSQRKHVEIFQTISQAPKHWQLLLAGDLVHLINGRAFKSNEWKTSGIPIIRIQNLNDDAKAFNYFQGDVSDGHRIKNGDMLLSWSGTPGTSFGAFIWNRGDAVLNQHIFKVVVYSKLLDKEYLRMTINACLDALIASARGGVGLKHVTKGQIEALQIPLPGLEEQKRVVGKVDELMKLCDELEVQQKSRSRLFPMLSRACHARLASHPTPTNLAAIFTDPPTLSPDDMRKTILSLAVQGKLIPFGEKAKLEPLDSTLAEPSSNGVSKGPTKDKTATEVLRISAGTSQGDFYVNEDDFKHVVLSAKEIEKHQLNTGDLLACRFNGNLHFVGRFSYYAGTSKRVQVNPDKLIRFRVDTAIHSPRYICLMMNSPPIRLAIEAMCATTAGNIGLSAGKIKTVMLPTPDLKTQNQVVERVDQLMELVDEMETQKQEADKIAELFAQVAASSIVGNSSEEQDVKAPKTELITRLVANNKPKPADDAPLSELLVKQKEGLQAKTLWQLSGLEIDTFYLQLKTEMANGWVVEPTKASMNEVEQN